MKIIEINLKIIYIVKDTTFMIEPGQDRKIAALRSSKCVCLFICGGNMNEKYMKKAIKEAKKALKKNDVPVGCVIVKDSKIIAKAYNKKENKRNATKHAEIIAISKACKRLKTWHLEDCKLYTTMEPCLMCSGAIIQSRINYICYSIKNENFGASEYLIENNKKIKIISDVLNDESKYLIQTFFKEKRR